MNGDEIAAAVICLVAFGGLIVALILTTVAMVLETWRRDE